MASNQNPPSDDCPAAAPLPGFAASKTFPRRRAIDVIRNMPNAFGIQPSSSDKTQSASPSHVSPTIPLALQSANQPARLRAIDMLSSNSSVPAKIDPESIPAKSELASLTLTPIVPSSVPFTSKPSSPHHQLTLQQRPRANDFFTGIPHSRPPPAAADAPSASIPRPIARLPKRARYQPKVDIDLTITSSESDEQESVSEGSATGNPHQPDLDSPDYIFNTNDVLATRQTIRGWNNSVDSTSWGRSREEFHADQVGLDRQLPAQLDDLPSFVISGGDMRSLHRYIMARYDITTYDEYIHLLALFRNTHAIDTHNAHRRLIEARAVQQTLGEARDAVIRRLRERHSAGTHPPTM